MNKKTILAAPDIHIASNFLLGAQAPYADQTQEVIKQITELQASLPPHVYQVRRDTPKVGRNKPCSCGSGIKNKKCCNTK